MYLWSVQSLSSLGWMVALLFTICCGLRLARFNTQIGAELPPYAYNFFTGVPAPAGAGLAIIPMLLNFEFGWSGFRSGWFGAVVLAAVGALMVSRVPTFSMSASICRANGCCRCSRSSAGSPRSRPPSLGRRC